MSHKPRSAALHIARKHQSAPKAHPADKEIMKAAEEIDTGRWVTPQTDEAALNHLGLALRNGSEEFLQDKPGLEEFVETRTMNEIAMHPRVIEAMANMSQEVDDAKTPEEWVERMCMMREAQTEQSRRNRWEGQQRWEGEETEAMRHGQLLTPESFMDRLEKVIGKGRLLRGELEVKTHALAKSGRVAIVIPNRDWKPEGRTKEDVLREYKTLHQGAKDLMSEVRGLRLLGRNSEADRKARDAQDMAMNAGGLLVEAQQMDAYAPRKYKRVATLQFPLGTEWMVMNFDEFGAPLQPKYLGWRTALLQLVRQRLISEEEAHKAFPVGSSQAAGWYLEQLQNFRHDGKALVN